MSSVSNNAMGPVKPADDDAREVFHQVKEQIIDKIHEIHHADHVHGLHETDRLKHISAFKVVQYAVEEVAYGFNYFAKIDLGENKYIHARAHKSHDGKVDFYSLQTTNDNAIWTLEEPLVYFND